MKKILLSCSAIIVAVLLASCGSNNTVATSNAGDIKKEDLYEKMKETAGPSVLQKLIISEVLTAKYGDDVSDKKVTKEFDTQKKQYGEQFPELLKNSNYTEASYKEVIKMNLLIEAAIKANTKLTDADYNKAWETYLPKMTVQHILVADEATAKDLITKINAGEDFGTLAKANSLDTGSKEDGGKLPEFDHTTPYDPIFIEASAKLKDGEVTQEPVNGANGYHIIKMIKNPGKGELKDHKAELEASIIQSKVTDENYVHSVLSKILKDAKIKIEDEDLKNVMDEFLKTDSSATSSSATTSSSNAATSSSK
ncbi:peptidylprolyl isomerase [Carnobacterium gallinarum]|uniref:peptidylprolyl isomerase n=1 Tax=Carnobacterium gallinarum TaxID=2749 RepID=UPI0005525C04|nr:peptidylprolyl isomerase [Carnobacterium gallinarum]